MASAAQITQTSEVSSAPRNCVGDDSAMGQPIDQTRDSGLFSSQGSGALS